ncbi:36282_t:CDS:1, partial [Racocetra persica]
VKSFKETGSTIYKYEVKLLREFKKYVVCKGKKKLIDKEIVTDINNRLVKIEEHIKLLEYQP